MSRSGLGTRFRSGFSDFCTKLLERNAFTPSAAVETKLGKWSPTLRTYRDMFTFEVVPTSGGKWAVAAGFFTVSVSPEQAFTSAEPSADVRGGGIIVLPPVITTGSDD